MNSDFPIERIMEACHQFVLSRQTRDGAFCYYLDRPWGVEEPNAKDTDAAVAILKMLERPVPHAAKCTRWLLAQQELHGSYSTMTFQTPLSGQRSPVLAVVPMGAFVLIKNS